MKYCIMCQRDKEDVVLVQVMPAGWNSFNSFAEVCALCQTSRRFAAGALALNRAKSRPARMSKAAAAAAPELAAQMAATQAAAESKAAAGAEVQISHRQTGLLLRTVESHTLAGADLSGAALGSADLRHAKLRGTDLCKADLHLADLVGADLRNADLRAVNFRGADLSGADLRDARMHRADLQHCVYDRATQWPAGFDPRLSGAVIGTLRR